MVVRDQSEGFLCIPQSQHAAISGQIARAWGNERFPAPEPWSEACLAAERHDDGMDDFDRAPELDPERGLPRDFMRMPLETWLGCWRRGPSLVAAESPYAGILVSMHGTGLLGYRRIPRRDKEGRRLADAYRDEQERLRGGWIESCRDDPELAPHLSAAALDRNRRLLALWDSLSLAICMPRLPDRFGEVPAGEDAEPALELEEVGMTGTGPIMVSVDPWPFAETEVPLAASGRLLTGRFEGGEAMREALAAAPQQTLEATLVPA